MRLPKQAHKNADPNSRQTNFVQNGVTTIVQKESAFYQIQQYYCGEKRHNYPIEKEKLHLFLHLLS